MADSTPSPGRPSIGRRLARLPAELLVGLYFTLDAIIGPLFRPIMRLLSRLHIIRQLEAAIAALPPYVLLVLLVVPFAVAELAKAYAVILMGSGHILTGAVVFVSAYVVSILVCERIFHAGRAQLMTIGWFARGFAWVMGYKERLLAWFRTTEVYRLATDVREQARISLRRMRTRLGATFGGKPGGLFGR